MISKREQKTIEIWFHIWSKTTSVWFTTLILMREQIKKFVSRWTLCWARTKTMNWVRPFSISKASWIPKENREFGFRKTMFRRGKEMIESWNLHRNLHIYWNWSRWIKFWWKRTNRWRNISNLLKKGIFNRITK